MTQRTRKLAGTALLVLFLAVYAIVATMAAVVLQVSGNRWIELAYYALAGLFWVVPAGALISWMSRPGR